MIIIERQKRSSENGYMSLCYKTRYTKIVIEFLGKQYQNEVMFWENNMLFEAEFLEKSGKTEFQDHYQTCIYCEEKI